MSNEQTVFDAMERIRMFINNVPAQQKIEL